MESPEWFNTFPGMTPLQRSDSPPPGFIDEPATPSLPPDIVGHVRVTVSCLVYAPPSSPALTPLPCSSCSSSYCTCTCISHSLFRTSTGLCFSSLSSNPPPHLCPHSSMAGSLFIQEGGKFIPESDGDSDPDASRSMPSTPSDLSVTSGDALARHEYLDHPIFEEGELIT